MDRLQAGRPSGDGGDEMVANSDSFAALCTSREGDFRLVLGELRPAEEEKLALSGDQRQGWIIPEDRNAASGSSAIGGGGRAKRALHAKPQRYRVARTASHT